MRHTSTLLLGLFAFGCQMGSDPLEVVDPNAAPERPTWSTHVKPIMVYYCTACHAPDAQTGAQEGYAYDTCDATRRGWDGVREEVFDASSMPPGGAPRLRPWELLTLARWWEQGGTCE